MNRRRIVIGTGPGSHLLLNEATASRRHAAIEQRWGRLNVVDLGSTNGTYLNGRRVNGRARIMRGDELRFGNARFALLAPGDDQVRTGLGNIRELGRSRARRLRVAGAIAAAMLLGLGSFIATEDLLTPVRPTAAGPAAHRAAGPAVPAGGGSSIRGIIPARAAGRDDAAAPGIRHPGPEWLARLNYYRAMLHLGPVAEDPALSAGDREHARYLVKTYAEDIRHSAIGADAHEESASSPWYSEQGSRAGRHSDVSYWQESSAGDPRPVGIHSANGAVMPWGSPGWSVDGWMGIPFHRLSLINPYLERSGYGQYCERSICAAALDTLTDRRPMPQDTVPFAEPLEFPPAGGIAPVRTLDNEWPDPLTACPGYSRPAGFPITLALGANVDARLSAYTLALKDSAGSHLEACGFDDSTYVNPDPGAQQRGRDVLRGFGAVVLIPRQPLDRGAAYTVTMTVGGEPYRWSFSTAP